MNKNEARDIKLAKQCLNHLGFECNNKQCKNKRCPLNEWWNEKDKHFLVEDDVIARNDIEKKELNGAYLKPIANRSKK